MFIILIRGRLESIRLREVGQKVPDNIFQTLRVSFGGGSRGRDNTAKVRVIYQRLLPLSSLRSALVQTIIAARFSAKYPYRS